MIPSDKTKPSKKEFLAAIKSGAECSLVVGNKTYMTLDHTVWAVDEFGNEYFPTEKGFIKTHDKYQGTHNEVVLC